MYCECKYYRKNILYPDTNFVLAWEHGVYPQEDEMRYCPWCGKEMKEGMIDYKKLYNFKGK